MFSVNNNNNSKNISDNSIENNNKITENNKRGRNSSFFLDNSVENKSKKVCEKFHSNSISLSLTEFEYFQLNLHKMKRIEILNSTETQMEVENDVEEVEDVEDVEDPEAQQILANKNPSLHDVMKTLANLTKTTNKTCKQVTSINTKLSTLTKKVDINSKNILILNSNAEVHDKIIMRNLENVNFIKQDKIDREVFVSGFDKMPDDRCVIKEICKFYNLPQNQIKSNRVIPSKNADGSFKNAFMNIEFCLKEDQINFLKAVRQVGQMTLKSVIPNISSTSSQNDSRKLKISRRLTIENRQVINRLRALLDENKIAKVRFRNCFYEIKPLQQENFVKIPSTEHLDLYLSS